MNNRPQAVPRHDDHVQLRLKRSDLDAALRVYAQTAASDPAVPMQRVIAQSMPPVVPIRPHYQGASIDEISHSVKMRDLMQDTLRLRIGGWASIVDDINKASANLTQHFDEHQERFNPEYVREMAKKISALNTALTDSIGPKNQNIMQVVLERVQQVVNKAIDSIIKATGGTPSPVIKDPVVDRKPPTMRM